MEDLTDRKYDMLKAVKFIEKKRGDFIWECRCDCGKIVNRAQKTLENKKSFHSCGCYESHNLTPGDSARCSKAGKRRAEVRNKDGVNIDMLDNSKNISTNTSGHKGISWSKTANRWHVYVGYKNYRCTLGYFEDFDDAVNIREKAVEAIEDGIFEDFFYDLRGFRIEERIQKQEKKRRIKRCLFLS